MTPVPPARQPTGAPEPGGEGGDTSQPADRPSAPVLNVQRRRRSTHPRADERRQRIAELTRQGLSAAQIADILKIATRTVIRARVATGTAKPAPVPLTREQLDRARELLEDGASASEAARTIGCEKTAVINHFPHLVWTRKQCSEHACLVREMKRALR